MLTDEQCNEFRRMPGSFNDMVRAIYEAGYNKCLNDLVNGLKDMPYYDELKKVLDND